MRELVASSGGEKSSQHAKGAWESLGHRLKGRYLSLAETRKIFKHSHKQFLTKVQELLESGESEDWLQGLTLIQQIPWEEAICLHGVVNMHATLLHRLERVDETLAIQRSHLLAVDHESLWNEKGLVFLQDSAVLREDDRLQRLQDLLDVGQRTSYAIPYLLGLSLQPLPIFPAQDKLMVFARRAFAWERWRKFENELEHWLPTLLSLTSQLLPTMLENDETKASQSFAKLVLRFPWELWTREPTSEPLEVLGLQLSRMEVWESLRQLAQRFVQVQGAEGVAHTWVGLSYLAQEEPTKASESYRKALRYSRQLRQEAIISFLGHFSNEKDWAGVEQALPMLHNPERKEVLGFRVPYHIAKGENRTALRLMERLCEVSPEEPSIWVRRWLLLETLGEEERLAQELLRALEQESDSAKTPAALALMGLHDTRHYRFETGLERLENVQEPDVSGNVWGTSELWARVLEAKGQCWRALGDEATALPWLMQALRAFPSEWRFHQVLLSLLQLEKREEAMALWEEAQAAYPDSLHIRYARFQLAEQEEDWLECWSCLQQIELVRFEELGLLKEGLFLFLRTLVYLDRWWDAFSLCETYLHEILEDEELSELRGKLLAEVGTQFHQMQTQLGQKQKELLLLERQHDALFKTLEQTRTKRDSLREALQQEESMREQLDAAISQQKQATLEAKHESRKALALQEREAIRSWVEKRSDIFGALSSSAHDILQSSEVLWRNLESHPSHDHGPVVMQLARVVESEVNRRLIDPLVAQTLSHGGRLQDLPQVAVGTLKPKKNRLSLGDSASLLFHRIEQEFSDGSTHVQLNPNSPPNHKERLEAFWQSERMQQLAPEFLSFFQQELPARLREVGKVRNKASHAGSPLSREQVLEVRRLVLGEEPGEGLLAKLVSLPR